MLRSARPQQGAPRGAAPHGVARPSNEQVNVASTGGPADPTLKTVYSRKHTRLGCVVPLVEDVCCRTLDAGQTRAPPRRALPALRSAALARFHAPQPWRCVSGGRRQRVAAACVLLTAQYSTSGCRAQHGAQHALRPTPRQIEVVMTAGSAVLRTTQKQPAGCSCAVPATVLSNLAAQHGFRHCFAQARVVRRRIRGSRSPALKRVADCVGTKMPEHKWAVQPPARPQTSILRCCAKQLLLQLSIDS